MMPFLPADMTGMPSIYHGPNSTTVDKSTGAGGGRHGRGLAGGAVKVQEHSYVDRAHYFAPVFSVEADPGGKLFAQFYPQRYYLEFFQNWKGDAKPLDVFQLPYVNGIRGQQPLALERTWTFDGMYEEHSGIRQREFHITGRSGHDPGDLQYFHAFRNFIERYAEESAKHKNAFRRGDDVRLVLNFPFEGESYFCSVIGYEFIREAASSRMSFIYSIVLRTHGWATRKWSLPSYLHTYFDKNDPNGDHTDPYHQCHHAANYAIEHSGDPTALPAAGHIEVEQAAAGAAPRQYERIVPPAVSGAIGGTKRDPDYYRTLWGVAFAATATLATAWSLLSPGRRAKVWLEYQFRNMWLNEIQQQCLTALGVQFEFLGIPGGVFGKLSTTGDSFELAVGGNYGPSGFSFALGGTGENKPPTATARPPRAVPVRPEPVTVTTVIAGDNSLMDVAARECGDAGLWSQLMRLNGWQDARTQGNGAPIAAGVALVLPAPAGTPAPSHGDLYGTDLLLWDGDLVMVGDDLATVSGPANLGQNIANRMRTPRGSNKAFPAYGLSERVGDSTGEGFLGRLTSDIVRQVTADHRVESVSKLTVEQAPGDTFRIGYEVQAITKAKFSHVFGV